MTGEAKTADPAAAAERGRGAAATPCRRLPLPRRLLLAAIVAYQRWISPFKGFRCAWRHHTGRASCSTLGWRAVRRYGVLRGLAVLRRRTWLCGVAHRRHRPPGPLRGRRFAAQRGECDIGCDLPGDCHCDLFSGRTIARVCDLASCCDLGGCDWPRRRRDGKRRDERTIHIPPRRGGGMGDS